MFFSIFCSFYSIFYCKMSKTLFMTYKKTQICQFVSTFCFGTHFVDTI